MEKIGLPKKVGTPWVASLGARDPNWEGILKSVVFQVRLIYNPDHRWWAEPVEFYDSTGSDCPAVSAIFSDTPRHRCMLVEDVKQISDDLLMLVLLCVVGVVGVGCH